MIATAKLKYLGVSAQKTRLVVDQVRGKTVDVTPSRYMDDLPTQHVESYEREDDKPMSAKELSSMVRELLDKHAS